MADLDETQETADFKSESTERIRQKAREREIVIIDEKLKWNAKSKIGSLDNKSHQPGGGRGSIVNEKLTWQGTCCVFISCAWR